MRQRFSTLSQLLSGTSATLSRLDWRIREVPMSGHKRDVRVYYVVIDGHNRLLQTDCDKLVPRNVVWTLDESRAWFTHDMERARFVAFLVEGVVDTRYAYN